jgi:hypothetical protein
LACGDRAVIDGVARRSVQVRQITQTIQNVRTADDTGEQQALMRGVMNGVLLSAALWAVAIYIANSLR